MSGFRQFFEHAFEPLDRQAQLAGEAVIFGFERGNARTQCAQLEPARFEQAEANRPMSCSSWLSKRVISASMGR